MSDVPEIEAIYPENGDQPYLECSGCEWAEGVTNEIDAEEARYWHLKCHEDGMPG